MKGNLGIRLGKLETRAPTRHEVWTQDDDNPDLYHHQSLTLSKRAETSPGLQVVRIVWDAA